MDTLLREILTSRVYEAARETPLDPAPRLSRRLGNEILLKREDLQPIFSFKLRGAYNRIARLSADDRARGVIAASAGNHAQGVAFSAQRLGLKALIVMPRTTPEIKVDAVRALGADVVLAGDRYAEAQQHAERLAAAGGLVFIHPFDDPLVIAGQGTIGMELLRQSPSLDAVFVPVGGGGLIAGIAAYIKALQPDVEVIGVEPVDADAMARSLAAGERVRLEDVGLFADGVAVQQVGAYTFPIVRATVNRIILVDNDEICAAIKDIFDDTRTIVEPAGALALAGLKSYVEHEPTAGRRLAAIMSGANMNFDRLRFVAERAELGEGRETLLAVTIPEQPGAFRAFCAALGARVVTEFNYRLSGRDHAEIFVGVATQTHAEGAALTGRLRALGYETADLSANEMAKLHVRHMVGGHPPAVVAERVCRFEFPERPGALLHFLDAVGGRWNISLFHYRNHGADFGRVLAAFEVPPSESAAFEGFLAGLDYRYALDEQNDAYQRFLAHL
ncbi:MAG TPA: threonine ammonia-lyase, biosynthetic [Vicinamibacterales bacterium]|jgi:threonine dehydratase